MTMPMCKCAGCGLLGRYSSTTRELLEVDIVNREKWRTVEGSDQFPVCSMQIFDLRKEWMECRNKPEEKKPEPLDRERDCPRFYPHNPGFSPKEHKEMLREDYREVMQREQRKEDLRFQAEQRQADADRRKSDQEFHAREKKWDRIMQVSSTIINVLLTAILGIILAKLGLKDK